MKKFLIAALMLMSSVAVAQNNPVGQGFCEIGGLKVATQGMQSSTKVQVSYPQCTVTVYQHGTVTLATLYSDNAVSPTPLANPFTAATTGLWTFYTAPGWYDIVLSGAGFASPFTLIRFSRAGRMKTAQDLREPISHISCKPVSRQRMSSAGARQTSASFRQRWSIPSPAASIGS